MARKMALSAVGRDCPGIVAAVSKVLFEHGCNIEDSSMTILRGEFAMILIVSMPDGQDAESLQQGLRHVEQESKLILSFRELPAETSLPSSGSPVAPYIVSVYGADKPGLVYRVTRLLADQGVNITDVNTRMVGAEGKPVYIMILEVEVPLDLSSGEVAGSLSKLAGELAVDITVRPLETASL